MHDGQTWRTLQFHVRGARAQLESKPGPNQPKAVSGSSSWPIFVSLELCDRSEAKHLAGYMIRFSPAYNPRALDRDVPWPSVSPTCDVKTPSDLWQPSSALPHRHEERCCIPAVACRARPPSSLCLFSFTQLPPPSATAVSRITPVDSSRFLRRFLCFLSPLLCLGA